MFSGRCDLTTPSPLAYRPVYDGFPLELFLPPPSRRRWLYKYCRISIRSRARQAHQRRRVGKVLLPDQAKVKLAHAHLFKHSSSSLLTHPNRTPSPQFYVFDVLHRSARIPHNAVDCKGWETHTRHSLKYSSLRHDRPVVLDC
jgi:hypothetical protein